MNIFISNSNFYLRMYFLLTSTPFDSNYKCIVFYNNMNYFCLTCKQLQLTVL